MPCTRWNSSPIFRALSRVIPLMLLRRSGSSSKMCRVLSPKVSTIRAAGGSSNSLDRSGGQVFQLPLRGRLGALKRLHLELRAKIRMAAPVADHPELLSGAHPGMVPTTVTSSWPLLSSNTVYPFFSFRKTTAPPSRSSPEGSLHTCWFLPYVGFWHANCTAWQPSSDKIPIPTGLYTGRLSVRPV